MSKDIALRAKQDNLILGGFVFTPTGMIVSSEPTFEEWESAGRFLQHVEKCIQFWIGDWLNWGELKWRESYAQVAAETGLEKSTLRNYKSVAAKVDVSLRSDKLPFAHHAIVASLPPAQQKKYLDLAEKEHLSSAQLSARIRKTNGDPPDFSITCPHCGKSIELDRYAETLPVD